MTTLAEAPTGRAADRGTPSRGAPLRRASALGLGVAMIWFSLLVLIPLTAILVTAVGGGWAVFAQQLTTPQTQAAVLLTVLTAFGVTLVNVIMGPLIAWVLVRDSFPGKRIIEVTPPFCDPAVQP